jgi:hypothetical protein
VLKAGVDAAFVSCYCRDSWCCAVCCVDGRGWRSLPELLLSWLLMLHSVLLCWWPGLTQPSWVVIVMTLDAAQCVVVLMAGVDAAFLSCYCHVSWCCAVCCCVDGWGWRSLRWVVIVMTLDAAQCVVLMAGVDTAFLSCYCHNSWCCAACCCVDGRGWCSLPELLLSWLLMLRSVLCWCPGLTQPSWVVIVMTLDAAQCVICPTVTALH